MDINYQDRDIQLFIKIKSLISQPKYQSQDFIKNYQIWLDQTIQKYQERQQFIAQQKQFQNQNIYCEIVDSFKARTIEDFIKHVTNNNQIEQNDLNNKIKEYYINIFKDFNLSYIKFTDDFDFGTPHCICGKEAKYRCSRCKNAWYCSKECQQKDWKQHKLVCKKQSDQQHDQQQNSIQQNAQNNNVLQILQQAESQSQKVKW